MPGMSMLLSLRTCFFSKICTVLYHTMDLKILNLGVRSIKADCTHIGQVSRFFSASAKNDEALAESRM
jgi:hypothetical protein